MFLSTAALSALGTIVGLLVPVACSTDTGADDDSGLSDGTGAFEDCGCPSGQQLWDCGCGDATQCAATKPDAENACDPFCVGTPDPGIIACAANPNSGSCSTWDPGSEITLSGGVYHMDWTWIGSLRDNPAPLWTCDDATLDPVTGGGFEVNAASSGEFLYELGLRNDDIPLELNDMPLDDFEDVSNAFFTLYLDAGETDYTLEVWRRGAVTTLYYQLDVT
jgi:hypothetical protein